MICWRFCVVHNIAEERVPGPGNEEDNEGNDLLGEERPSERRTHSVLFPIGRSEKEDVIIQASSNADSRPFPLNARFRLDIC
jgi:hypothetical protein